MSRCGSVCAWTLVSMCMHSCVFVIYMCVVCTLEACTVRAFSYPGTRDGCKIKGASSGVVVGKYVEFC